MTIQEKIYIRFLTSLTRLKGEEKVNDKILKDVVKEYLEIDITTPTNFSIKLMREELLIKTITVTSLMEVSETWIDFNNLYTKQKQRIENLEYPSGENVDFEEVMRKILK